MAHGLGCCVACGIFPDQGLNLCVLGTGCSVRGIGRELTDDADRGKSRKDRDLSTGLRAVAFTGDLDQFQGGAGSERGCEREGPERK